MIGVRVVASVAIGLHIVEVNHHWQLRIRGLQQIRITVEEDIRRYSEQHQLGILLAARVGMS
jgi:predicted ABC-type sugar transport system permease subunit